MRDLNEIFVEGQTAVLSFGGASVAQVIKMMEFQGENHLDTLVIMLGTNGVSIVSNTGCGLAGSGTGTVQLRDYAQVCGPQWIASGQYPWTLEHPISHGRPSESQRADTTCKEEVSFWQRISPKTSITRCTDSLLNLPDKRLVNTRETISERPRWKEKTGDMQG